MKKEKTKTQLLELMSQISIILVVSCDDNNEVLFSRDFSNIQTIVIPTLDWEYADWILSLSDKQKFHLQKLGKVV